MGFACSTEHVGWKYEVSFCTYTTNITARVLYSSNMLTGVLNSRVAGYRFLPICLKGKLRKKNFLYFFPYV